MLNRPCGSRTARVTGDSVGVYANKADPLKVFTDEIAHSGSLFNENDLRFSNKTEDDHSGTYHLKLLCVAD